MYELLPSVLVETNQDTYVITLSVPSFFGVSFLLGLGVLFYSWKRSILISLAKLAEGPPFKGLATSGNLHNPAYMELGV